MPIDRLLIQNTFENRESRKSALYGYRAENIFFHMYVLSHKYRLKIRYYF